MYRILVVEDDEVIAKTIRQHLQSLSKMNRCKNPVFVRVCGVYRSLLITI